MYFGLYDLRICAPVAYAEAIFICLLYYSKSYMLLSHILYTINIKNLSTIFVQIFTK